MTVEKLDLTNEGASLTAYIQDPSPELPNFEKRPAMLVIPGGGYNFCSDREGEPVALAFMAMGFNAFVLRYSIKENAAFPAPLAAWPAVPGRNRRNPFPVLPGYRPTGTAQTPPSPGPSAPSRNRPAQYGPLWED